jgi:indole-3-glycerol phosphate synthase
MMKDILTKIVEHKLLEIKTAKLKVPIETLKSGLKSDLPPIRSMSASLGDSATGIIAEFKRKSPSKGWINEKADPVEVSCSYEAAGASALSVLTDNEFFGGSLSFIGKLRPIVGIPILRKEFIVDEYQLFEARLAGADAVLLIAACLSHADCRELVSAAHSLGLETLLEIHSEGELGYLDCGSDMVGVNNRNLGTFVTDVSNSFRLANLIKASGNHSLLVSESGISDPAVVRALREEGFRGFLMGEHFMKEENPGEALAGFMKRI